MNINWKNKEEFLSSVISVNCDAGAMINDAIEWIKNNLSPEDVFPTRELEKWAESEGYSKQ